MARIAGLLAVAVLPLVSGLGTSLTDPVALAPAYRRSMLICAGLLVVGGHIALLTIPSSFTAIRPDSEPAVTPDTTPAQLHCAITAPPLQPGRPTP